MDLDAEILKNRLFREKYTPMLEDVFAEWSEHKAREAEREKEAAAHAIEEAAEIEDAKRAAEIETARLAAVATIAADVEAGRVAAEKAETERLATEEAQRVEAAAKTE